MARVGNGTTAKIVSTGSVFKNPSTGDAKGYTYAFWYRDPNAPGTAAIRQPFCISAPNANADSTQLNYGFSWSHTSAAFQQAAFHRKDSVPTTVAAKLTSVLLANTWYHIAGRWDLSNLTVWLNGSKQATTAVTTIAYNADTSLASILCGTSQNTSFAQGTIAEVCVWNYALPDHAIAALAAGCVPAVFNDTTVTTGTHPASYWPCLGDSPEPDLSPNHRSGTVTAATVANHPGTQSLTAFP